MRLEDRFGRLHTSLRISVTDRCNIRCVYCMPERGVRFVPRAEILSFEEIIRFVRCIEPLGVRTLRLTGGEPLARSQLDVLVRGLASITGITEIALTTNGTLLADQAHALRDAGLDRINISLDAVTEEAFERIARRRGIQRVLDGIDAARAAGFAEIRLNAVAIAGLSEDQIVPLAHLARQRDLHLRFIEFMPLDGPGQWRRDAVLSGQAIRQRLEHQFGPLHPVARLDPSQPATDYAYADTGQRVGFIDSVTEPFCRDCNRLRVTADGKVRNCLFATDEWDVRALLRRGASDEEIRQLVVDCVAAKRAGHGMDSPTFVRPARAMYQIGG